MKDEVFYGKGMGKLKKDYKEIYDVIVDLNDVVWDGKALDYKTQKLIAIGISAANVDARATKKQMISAKKEMNITKEEAMDVLRVVLLTSGMQAFNNALQILNEIYADE